MDLCLGTVQFGLKYGVSGNKQPDLTDCIEMLDYAYSEGITSFDTASAYGVAEEVLGEFIKRKKIRRAGIEIISKVSPNLFKEENKADWYINTRNAVIESLHKLNTDYLDGCMLHNASKLNDYYAVEVLHRLKEEGLVKSIGASVYTPVEAERNFEYTENEIIQIPYNIFDQRLNKSGFFEADYVKDKKIYARSALLQGLLLMKITDIPNNLEEAVPLVQKFDNLCKAFGITREQAAISFVKLNNRIKYLVFGVDNLTQLKEFIQVFKMNIDNNIIKQIAMEFTQVSDYIVMPYLWNK